MSVLLVTWWNRLGWEHIDTWKHLQTTFSCFRRKLPYFCGHVPQESGTRVGGSLSENWPKRHRHFYKISHWRQLRMLIYERWSFKVNEFTHEKFDEADYWSEFEGLTAETELIVAIRLKFLLLWADLNY